MTLMRKRMMMMRRKMRRMRKMKRTKRMHPAAVVSSSSFPTSVVVSIALRSRRSTSSVRSQRMFVAS